MITSKPFSTISYNTDSFLKDNLNKLVDSGLLDFYAFIHHSAEDDELKDHIHVYFVPSTRMDTRYMKTCLNEFDPKMPDKPLSITICVSSKFDDFYMYALHDSAYLASKGQSRKYHYIKDDFITSDKEHLSELARRIDKSKYVGMQKLVEAVDNGVPFMEMVRLGQIPIQLINQYRYAYECLCSTSVQRAGRETHTPARSAELIDEETGEILYSTNRNRED